MAYEISVEENFSDEGLDVIEKIKNSNFDSKDISDLKFKAEELSNDEEINELVSYDLIKDNLEYKLDYQKEGALKIIRDLNCTALLADEVGLGKTITTGMVIKESLTRGFVKTVLVLVPPSLVDQWSSELKEKFNLDFRIIKDENSWDNVELAIASIDRVKVFNKKSGRFNHYKAHQISWDLLIVDEGHKLKARSSLFDLSL